MAQDKLQKLELTWIGKDEKREAIEPRILIEDPKYSYGDTESGNMLIHGDNLLALKALEQEYSGKVKCIYIDPPYNTGSAFEHYDDGLEHSIWLSLMRERIQVLYNLLDKKEGTITSYLKKNSQNLMYSSKKKGDGQYAITHYKIIKENQLYSLADVNIDTGRKNQIRVHFGDLGHFIIGDDKYGEPSNPLKRLGLHAYELDIINPLSKKMMKFKAPIPKEFEELFTKNAKK